jgi:hypothetical protein
MVVCHPNAPLFALAAIHVERRGPRRPIGAWPLGRPLVIESGGGVRRLFWAMTLLACAVVVTFPPRLDMAGEDGWELVSVIPKEEEGNAPFGSYGMAQAAKERLK